PKAQGPKVYHVQIVGTDKPKPPGNELELGDLLVRAAKLDCRVQEAYQDRWSSGKQLKTVEEDVIDFGVALGSALGEVGRTLAYFADVAYARLWVHVDEASDLDALPWEALTVFGASRGRSEYHDVSRLGGWQVLRARDARDTQSAALESVLILVG